ncbi:Riboflavin biosynthesis protein RibF [[Clostridium] ultunense Esp]|nr:Riboflavin biosynthesis protein RibF [[Clostridium] ultunense Esp]
MVNMEIIDLNNYEESRYETGVALGNFDGIHIGHQHLIKDNIDKAKERNLKSSVLLFKNHTKTILDKEGKSKLEIITPYNQKLEILDRLGVDLIYTINFDKNLMKLSPEEFVRSILIDRLNAKLVTVGFDYRFGHKAAGDSEYLIHLGKEEGFQVNIIEPIYVNEEVVSSTLIRNLIKSGSIEKANNLIGRYYSIVGQVVKGRSRGSKIGYPTANLRLEHEYVIPKTGVYKTITILGDKEYISLTNIGYNPTFNEDELKIENYILNFNNNIYGKHMEVKFLEFIRDDIKFNTTQELIEQIKRDVEYVKKHQ